MPGENVAIAAAKAAVGGAADWGRGFLRGVRSVFSAPGEILGNIVYNGEEMLEGIRSLPERLRDPRVQLEILDKIEKSVTTSDGLGELGGELAGGAGLLKGTQVAGKVAKEAVSALKTIKRAAKTGIPRNAAVFELETQGGMLTRDGRILQSGAVKSRTDFLNQTPVRRVDFDHTHRNLGAPHVNDLHVNPNNPTLINAGKRPRLPEPGEYLSPVLSDPRIQGGVFRP